MDAHFNVVNSSAVELSKLRIGLVATCLNEADSFEEWRGYICSQTKKPDIIIIVDAGSTDGTLEMLHDWSHVDPSVKVILENRCNAARARNLAISQMEVDVIASCDFGNSYAPNWVEDLCAPLEHDSSVMVVAGSYTGDPRDKTTLAARAAFLWNDDYHARFTEDFLPANRSLAFRREVWEKTGGYPEDLTFYGDDLVFGLLMRRMGFKFAFAETALAIWSRHKSLKQYWREGYKYGLGCGEAGCPNPRIQVALRFPFIFTSLFAALYAIVGLFVVFRGLGRGEILPALIVFPLRWGYYFNEVRGYRIGNRQGASKCKVCRQRLLDSVPR